MPTRVPSGHVYRRTGRPGDPWYAKYRLPDGRQVHRRIGPAWTSRGRPAGGYVTKRTAEAWLCDLLDEARRGALPGMVPTGATFADPVTDVEKPVQTRATDDVFSPEDEDVTALVRVSASEQDAAIYLTAAFTGLRRGELVVALARRRLRPADTSA